MSRNPATEGLDRGDLHLFAGGEVLRIPPEDKTDFPMPNVLVVDDDPVNRKQLERFYGQNGYSVVAFSSGEAGLRRLDSDDIDLVITSTKLPGMDGVQFISDIQQKHPGLPVIAMTGYAEIHTAVEALKVGACDFVTKPFDLAAVLESTRATLESAKGPMELRYLRRWLGDRFQFNAMLSQTGQMHRVFEMILMAAPTDMPVWVCGEPGTGKETVARAIHQRSNRRGGPFIAVRCSIFSESFLESELFGCAKGASFVTEETQLGKIALARGGTLFLDDVESLSLTTQEKMLRLFDSGEGRHAGASESAAQGDLRVIVASRVSLKERVAEGAMRRDFYERINVLPIHLIPLRERSMDIPLLVQNFLQHHPVAKCKKIVGVSTKILRRLMEYSWPDNIRELHHLLECAILLTPGRIIEEVALPEAVHDASGESDQIASSASLRQWLRQKEKLYLSRQLEYFGGNVGLTAKKCRIGVRTLSRKMRIYGLDKKLFKEPDGAGKPAQSSSRPPDVLGEPRTPPGASAGKAFPEAALRRVPAR
jgi:DNA-binding NtrC family response regulator